MRDKFMTYGEFTGIQQHEWSAVKVSENARPTWMKNVPTGITLASGASCTGISYRGSGTIIGGIDHYRLASDDPVAYNKDNYIVVSGINASGLLAIGPSKDGEHWTDTIPSYEWDI